MFNEAPITIYWDVEAVQPNVVRFATYGRGIWEYSVPQLGGGWAYGQGKLNSLGSQTQLGGVGTPSLSVDDFELEGLLGVPLKPGLVIWSYDQAAIPFQGGTLCMVPPLRRTPLMFSGGAPPEACTGSYAFDLNGWIQGAGDPLLAPGVQIQGQIWSRDTNSSNGSGLTDAVELVVCP